MASTVVLSTPMLQNQSGIYTGTLVNEDDRGILVAQFQTLTLTYYDCLSGTIINSRVNQNVLNTNDVTLANSGNPIITTITWFLQPEDTALVDDRHEVEWHMALFEWTWADGTKHMAHEVMFSVERLTNLDASSCA